MLAFSKDQVRKYVCKGTQHKEGLIHTTKFSSIISLSFSLFSLRDGHCHLTQQLSGQCDYGLSTLRPSLLSTGSTKYSHLKYLHSVYYIITMHNRFQQTEGSFWLKTIKKHEFISLGKILLQICNFLKLIFKSKILLALCFMK